MAVRSRNSILYFDFYFYLPGGRKTRCQESSGLKDNEKNRKIAHSKNKAIQYELRHGRFDYLHFFPTGAKAKILRQGRGQLTFSELWDLWTAEKSLRWSTSRSWQSAYKTHIGPYFGHQSIQEIDDSALLVFRKSLEAKKLSASSINDKVMKLVCMCLYYGYKKGMIAAYPCDGIKRLFETPPEIDPLSFEELKHFLETLKERKPKYYDMFLLWAHTGMRPGEVYALKWKNVDYFNRKLMIRETRLEHSDGPPKTLHSIRDVDLSQDAVKALKRHEKRTGLQDSYIFQTEAGRPYSDAFMRKKFRHLLRLAGLRYRQPKNMRHTFATLHIAAGENITWVSRQLGHASVEITLKRYNRFIPNLTRRDGSAFRKIMTETASISDNQVTHEAK